MKLVSKKKFEITAFYLEDEHFIIYIASLTSLVLNFHSFYRVLLTFLLTNKALTLISLEYTNFTNIFFPRFIAKLFEHIGIDNYLIDLVDYWYYLMGISIA